MVDSIRSPSDCTLWFHNYLVIKLSNQLPAVGPSLSGPGFLHVLHFQFLRFPPLTLESTFPGSAFCTPDTWSHVFRSCIFSRVQCSCLYKIYRELREDCISEMFWSKKHKTFQTQIVPRVPHSTSGCCHLANLVVGS